MNNFESIFRNHMERLFIKERFERLYNSYLIGYRSLSLLQIKIYNSYVWSTTFYKDLIRQHGSRSTQFKKLNFAKDFQYRADYLQKIYQLFQKFIQHPYYFMQQQLDKIHLNTKDKNLPIGRIVSINYIDKNKDISEEQAQSIIDMVIQNHLKQSYLILFQKYTLDKGIQAIKTENIELLHIFLVLKNIQLELKNLQAQRKKIIEAGSNLLKVTEAGNLFTYILYIKQVRKNDRKRKREIEKNYNKQVESMFPDKSKKIKSKEQIERQAEEEAKKQYEQYKENVQKKKSLQLVNSCDKYLTYLNKLFKILWQYSQFQYDFQMKQIKPYEQKLEIPKEYQAKKLEYHRFIKSLLPTQLQSQMKNYSR